MLKKTVTRAKKVAKRLAKRATEAKAKAHKLAKKYQASK